MYWNTYLLCMKDTYLEAGFPSLSEAWEQMQKTGEFSYKTQNVGMQMKRLYINTILDCGKPSLQLQTAT